jgi:hypothetical protein
VRTPTRAGVACAAAAVAALLPAQERRSLAGTWRLRPEPRDDAHPEIDVAVPGPFEAALGTAFDGVAWYRTVLPLDAAAGGARVRVEFAAVAAHATVLCNGVEAGQHLGPWTPFRVDLTSALRAGDNVLEVRVDERVGHNTQGFLPVIQPHFGGIWQDVTLCVDHGAVIDRLAIASFGHADGALDLRVPTLPGPQPETLALEASVLDGSRAVATAVLPVGADGVATGRLAVPGPRRWSPGAANLYGLRLALRGDGGRELDRVERRTGFRSLAADGTLVRWNGEPLQVRGLLHWGYSPPHLAPPADEAFWRRQLEDARSLGFNTLKCCLWVPPPVVYDLCDELGLCVWQEYPTWHPHMDQAHKDELLREYREFYAADGSHPAVAFRSLTCETGQGADLDVVKALFDGCHAAVPETLVVDDSSWIGWQRVTDFWDEHPYGNNRWWPGRLAEFLQHIAEKGKKPLLLGECIAADTWADRAAWLAAHGEQDCWWRPACFQDQQRFEAWLAREFGEPTLRSLGPVSRAYAMATRRYQIERLRLTIPEAGYVVSVARDFQKARMGLYDDLDRLKWSAGDWSWHGDAMLCLDTPHDRRAFVAGTAPPTLHARLARGASSPSAPVPVTGLERALPVTAPRRVRVGACAEGIAASWDVWLLPPFDDARPAGVQVVERLDPATLDFLEQGGRVYLHAHGQKRSPKSEVKWYLTGAPFAPPHPVHARLPADMLLELQAFDLDGGRVLPWQPWLDQVDPILAFWETHDIAEVKAHLFAFDCNVGKGRLLVSALDDQSDAGRYAAHAFLLHLADGPAPRRSLLPATLEALRALLAERRIDLPVWRFRTDPKDEGRAGNWQLPSTDVGAAPWRDLRAGSHWENQGDDLVHYDGVAWYRVDVDVPAGFATGSRLVFEGIDDSGIVWLDGEQVGAFGDPATETSVWLQRSVAELGGRLTPGRHSIAVRVVDHGGAGGLWKPVFVTTGHAEDQDQLLH